MKRLIYALLSLLGFGAVSCEELGRGGNLDLYGAPWTEYSVSGRVVDAEGNPIGGIMVSWGDSLDNPEGFWNAEITNQNGAFVAYDKSNYLRFEDVDGEENGGEFETKYMQITPQHFDGFSAELGDVVLTEKSTEE